VVSPPQAALAAPDSGYVIRDTSSNGVFVNGERVQGSQRLSRADVLRVGGEEFRFYADVPATAATMAGLPPAAPIRAETPVPSLADTLFTQRAVDDVRKVLAELEVLNEGPSKGVRYAIRTPLAQVGRGPNNDIRLTDESVSEIHAKLQRRDEGWHVVDMNSTNGTYVGGSRVTGERRLEGAPDVRFGGVKLRFIPAGMSAEEVRAHAQRDPATGERALSDVVTAKTSAATAPGAGTSRLLVALLLLVAVAVIVLMVRGRA
jgi:pSer/pThr/pTyr-binding forkhead associated (FHA) protein